MIHENATASVAVPQKAADRRPTPWERRLRRFGHVERPRTSTRDRLTVPFPEPASGLQRTLGLSPASRSSRWSGWIGPLLVALVAGPSRFWRLGSPRAVVFDESYYAKDAWALLQHGYEGAWPADYDATDQLILADPQRIPLGTDPSFVVHPPVGKWVIALGEWAFGLNPAGWRFMVALLGTASVLMLCRIGRRLFRSTALGCLAGVLMAVDGLHFVMSRTALLDLIVMFFVLAAFGALLIDRDRARARLAAALPESGRPEADTGAATTLGWRPWRIAAGVLLGLACATKWNGMFYLAAFGIMAVLWDAGARRVAGARHPYRAMLRRDAGPAFLSLIPVALATYVVSWTGWFATGNGYFRHWPTDGAVHGRGSRRRCAACGTTNARSTTSTSISRRITTTSRTRGAGWCSPARCCTSPSRPGSARAAVRRRVGAPA